MTASSKDLSGPTFNLKVVERKTGIKSHTLRSWEDRYDLPKPIRTDGGHRRYTLHDLDVIRWLSARLREGMKISRAVELWRSIEAAGEDPFMSKNLPIDEHILTQEMDTALEKLRENWIASCLKFDEAQANRILVQAFSLYPTSVVCIEILQKGLAHIGQMWFRNQATVQQEHFTSSYVVRRLDALIAAAPLPTKLGQF